jgi:hypothetical protein
MKEMSRGISTIIAAILLLIITIGLASAAYIFITNFLYSQTSKTIQVLSADCNNNNITLVVANHGSETIGNNELKVYINNDDQTSNFTALTPLDPQDTEVHTWDPEGLVPGGSVNILVISPSNSQPITIWC